jgi:hypothetical protein
VEAARVRWIGAVLALLFATTAAAQDGVPQPRADAWPSELLAVLIEHNPWAMVIGADTPRVSLFADGTVIRLEPQGEKTAPRLMVSQLTAAELAKVRSAVRPAAAFWKLEKHYNVVPGVTDQMTTELVVYDGKRFNDVSVYGYSSVKDASDRVPAEFERLCKLLIALKPRHAVPWQPRWLEVMVWPYEHSPGAPLTWPAKWPNFKSRLAFPQKGEMCSLILPGSEERALREFLAGRGERQAVAIDGKKWSVEYRPVMPGSRVAQTVAERLAARNKR